MSKINQLIAGVDEVGRGCLAGPVIAAAVILKTGINLKIIKDSKKLNFNQREKIAQHIKKFSFFAIGQASQSEIDRLNIHHASLLAMKRAIIKLKKKPEKILIDGAFSIKEFKNSQAIIKGDQKIKCISAASIIAKSYRDTLMIKLSKKFKNYAWETNFGYGTKSHLMGLKKYGVTLHHRKGFGPVHNILFKQDSKTQ